MSNAEEHRELLDEVEHVLDYQFKDPTLLLAALTHPSAVEGHSLRDSYERLEFLGDSILGAVVADRAFHAYPKVDEGGLTRIKVSLVSGASLSKTAEGLGFADFIIFGSSETGSVDSILHSRTCMNRWSQRSISMEAGRPRAHSSIERSSRR